MSKNQRVIPVKQAVRIEIKLFTIFVVARTIDCSGLKRKRYNMDIQGRVRTGQCEITTGFRSAQNHMELECADEGGYAGC